MERARFGRQAELARISSFLDAVPTGPEALILGGEAGIGKSALWLDTLAQAQARSYRALSSRPTESEAKLSFAALGDLLDGVVEEALDALPPPQRSALEVALLRAEATTTPPDRRTLSSAFHGALMALAGARPLVLAIDDAQWLDEPSLEAFLFAGRRLGAEGVAMLGALREGTAVAGLEVPWLELLRIEPLAETEARELLTASQVERMAPAVADRLVETSAGNPLALLEIPRLLSDGQRAGREPLEEPLRPGTGVERAFRRALDPGARP